MNQLLFLIVGFMLVGTIYAVPNLTEIDKKFDEIGKKYSIPSEILKAIAYRNTNWDPLYSDNEGEHKNEKGRFGIMGLRALDTNDSIDFGARVLQVDKFHGISNYENNIEMAAALIKRVENQFLKEGYIVESIEDYAPILVMYLDFAPSMKYYAERYVYKMFKDIEMGYKVETSTESFHVRGVNIDFSKLVFTGGDEIIAPPTTSAPSGIRWAPAHRNNYTVMNRTAADIDMVVIHQAEGSYEGCIAWFQSANNDRHTSAHYCISRDGEITQLVKIKDKAHHAGNLNSRSIGIEHEGRSTANLFTETEYQASAMLVKWLAETYTIPLDKSHIVRHHGNCPGPYWRWDYYWTLLLGNSSEGTVSFTQPQGGETIGNPVVFKANATGDVAKIKYFADDTYFLGESTSRDNNFEVTYSFNGVDRLRDVVAKGYDAAGNLIPGAEHRISFTPTNAGQGTVRFISPTNNSESYNPTTFKAFVSGDVKMVKYFAENTYLLGESADSTTEFSAEYLFNQTGWRVIQVKGYNADGVFIPGAFEEIRINVLDVECEHECELNSGGCLVIDQMDVAGVCQEINGCRKLVPDAICPAEDRCEGGVCIKNISGNCHHDCREESYLCFHNSRMLCEDYDGDGCFEWHAEEHCGGDQECTVSGCQDIVCWDLCNTGDTRCSGEYLQECGQFDPDHCMEWGNTTACEEGKTCRNGLCVNSGTTCTNQCTANTIRCSGNKIEICKINEENGCYAFAYEKTCATGQVCANGRCLGDSTIPDDGDISDTTPIDNGGGSSEVDNGGLDTGVGLSCSKSNAINLSGSSNGSLTLPFNYTDTKDTKNATLKCFDNYPPNELNEGGPEYLYVFTIAEDAFFSASIKSPEPEGTDIDLHLITSLDRSNPGLIERGHYRVEASLRPGTYYLSMDTFVTNGVEQKGKYELTLSIEPKNVSCTQENAISLSGTSNTTVSVPFTYGSTKNTRNSTMKCFDKYPPNSTNEGGPEYMYVFSIREKAYFTAFINTPEPSGTDIDVHLIQSLDPRDPKLVARGDYTISATIEPGTYYIVLDTYVSDSGEMKGAYSLTVKLDKPGSNERFTFPYNVAPTADMTTNPRNFGSNRDGGARKHAGVDLYGPVGRNIYAVGDGKILAYYYFYDGTYAVEVDHGDFVIRYGEVGRLASGVSVGSRVKRGDLIAHVGHLQSLNMSMLHFERYSGTMTGALTNRANKPYQRRKDLVNPTSDLLKWKYPR